MGQVNSAGPGVWWPSPQSWQWTGGNVFSTATLGTLNAATNKCAYIGRCYIYGKPASKVISSAGGSISFVTGAVTWAGGATSVIRVGIQDTDGSTAPVMADGTFDVYGDLVQGTDAITASTLNTALMGSGSKTITHGQLIAVVLDMTGRGGSDSVAIAHQSAAASPTIPCCRNYASSTWGAPAAAGIPNVGITFDDGTVGYLDGGFLPYSGAVESYADATNPDERGNLFQVPWDCKVDAIKVLVTSTAATSDGVLTLYSDPLGTPAVIVAVTIDGADFGTNTAAGREMTITLAADYALSRNTTYAWAYKANGAGNLNMGVGTVAATFMPLMGGGAVFGKTTRNGGSGAFASVSSTLFYGGAVRICSFDDGRGWGPRPQRSLGG